MPVISAAHLRDRARSSFWLIPAGCVAIAVGFALALPHVDEQAKTFVLFPAGPESARSFLSSITSAMISFTGLVFSITIVALQLSSGQYSSRAIRNFLRDRVIQFSFGVFVATFTYAMIVQRAVLGTSTRGGFVPQLAVTVAFLLVLASVALFVAYISHIANAIRVATIVTSIGAATRAVLEDRYPVDPQPAGPAPPDGPPVRCVGASRAGVIVSVQEAALVAHACAADCVIVLLRRVGDFVPAGTPLFAVFGRADALPDRRLLADVAFDSERTYEQDVAFGFRELVDIAERALSPGINDPTTAAQAIDVLHDLLRRLATRPTPSGHHTDDDGTLRLVVPVFSFPDFLALSVEEIQHYGRDDVQTPRRLHAMLSDLRDVALPEHRPAVEKTLCALEAATSVGRDERRAG